MLNVLERYWNWRNSLKYPMVYTSSKGFRVHKREDGKFAIFQVGKYTAPNDMFRWGSNRFGEYESKYCFKNKKELEQWVGDIPDE